MTCLRQHYFYAFIIRMCESACERNAMLQRLRRLELVGARGRDVVLARIVVE